MPVHADGCAEVVYVAGGLVTLIELDVVVVDVVVVVVVVCVGVTVTILLVRAKL